MEDKDKNNISDFLSSALHDAKNSTIASLIATVTYNPIEVTRTQYQVTTNKTFTDIVRGIIKEHGYRGFYKGFSSNCIADPIFWTFFFELKKLNLQPTGTHFDQYFNSYFASSVSSAICNPIHVVKVRLQTSALYHTKYNSFTFTKRIYNNEGLFAFMKGYSFTLANNLKLGLQFPLYDFLKEYTDSVPLSSLVSKLACDFIFYPATLARTVQRDTRENLSLKNIVAKIYKSRGFSGFYRGMLMFCLINMPNFVMMMYIKEYLTEHWS